MATALDIVTAALQEIAVLAASDTPSAQEATDALVRLNRFIDRLTTEKLTIYTLQRSFWTIIAGQQNYLVGSGLAVDIPRPTYINTVSVVDLTTQTETPLEKITDMAYEHLSVKQQSAAQPKGWYMDAALPARIRLYPVPTSSSLLGIIYHWQATAQLPALSTVVLLPPGYEEMLVTNLAVLLCPVYERQANPHLRQAAVDSLAGIKRGNLREMDMTFEPAALIGSLRRVYDINTG